MTHISQVEREALHLESVIPAASCGNSFVTVEPSQYILGWTSAVRLDSGAVTLKEAVVESFSKSFDQLSSFKPYVLRGGGLDPGSSTVGVAHLKEVGTIFLSSQKCFIYKGFAGLQ